jgi:hypothetical protein
MQPIRFKREEIMKIKALVMSMALFVIFVAVPVSATDCATEINNIQDVLTIELITREMANQVITLLNLATTLCQEGKTTEAMVPINEAKALLGIQ